MNEQFSPTWWRLIVEKSELLCHGLEPNERQDVAQSAAAKILKLGLKKFKKKRNKEAYVTTVVVSARADYFRKLPVIQKARRKELSEDLHILDQRQSELAEEQALKNVWNRLMLWMKWLKEKDRRLIEMLSLSTMNIKDIAKAVKMSPSKATRRIEELRIQFSTAFDVPIRGGRRSSRRIVRGQPEISHET